MPLYEYQCDSCEKVILVRQSIHEAKLKTCSQAAERAVTETKACGTKARVRRLISDTSFVLKGDGWVGKDIKEKKSRDEHSVHQQKRMEEHGGHQRIRRIKDMDK